MADNARIIREIYEAFGRGDIAAVLGAMHDNVNWIEAEGFPYGGNYRGPDSVLSSVFSKLGEEWEGFSAVPGELVAQGDSVVALGTYTGKYRATGKAISVPFAHAWKLRAGKVASFQQYTDTAVVRRALA